MDGTRHSIDGRWDLIIAHPPCTYLAASGSRWFNVEKYGEAALIRQKTREMAEQFFMEFANAPCDKIVIENPVGTMSTVYRKPDQIIQPYWFGDPARKATCLWLKGVPKLEPTNIVEPNLKQYTKKNGQTVTFSADYGGGDKNHRERRSKTYFGIARAFAEQWGKEE